MPKKVAKSHKTHPDEFIRADLTKGVYVSMDLSKSMTGWAVHADTKLVGYDAARIGGDKLWHTYDNMRTRATVVLRTAHAMTGQAPDLIIVEDAMKQPGLASRIYECLYLAVSEVAGRGLWLGKKAATVPMAVVAPTQVKAAVLGKDNRQGATKGDVVRAIMGMYPIGLDPERAHPDSDIADAIGVYVAATALASAGRLRVGP